MIHLDFNVNKLDEVVEIYLDEINEPIEVDFPLMYSWAKMNCLTSNVRSYQNTDKKENMTINEYFKLPYDILKEDVQRYYLEKIIK